MKLALIALGGEDALFPSSLPNLNIRRPANSKRKLFDQRVFMYLAFDYGRSSRPKGRSCALYTKVWIAFLNGAFALGSAHPSSSQSRRGFTGKGEKTIKFLNQKGYIFV